MTQLYHFAIQRNRCMTEDRLAICLDGDRLSENEMRILAQNANVDEVVYVMSSQKGNYRLRFFKKGIEEEICFVGLIGTIHFFKMNPYTKEALKTVSLEINTSVITLDITKQKILNIDALNYVHLNQKAIWLEALNQTVQPYEKEKFLVEVVPTTAWFIENELDFGEHIFAIRKLSTCFKALKRQMVCPQYRLQANFASTSTEAGVFKLFIQDFETGKMVKFSAFSKYVSMIEPQIAI